MSSPLSGDLQKKYGVRAMPIRKDDEVRIVLGVHKGKEGKVTQVYRKKFVIYIDRVTKDKANGTPVPVGIPANNVRIIKLKLDKDRNNTLARRAAAKSGSANKGKVATSEIMADVD